MSKNFYTIWAGYSYVFTSLKKAIKFARNTVFNGEYCSLSVYKEPPNEDSQPERVYACRKINGRVRTVIPLNFGGHDAPLGHTNRCEVTGIGRQEPTSCF